MNYQKYNDDNSLPVNKDEIFIDDFMSNGVI